MSFGCVLAVTRLFYFDNGYYTVPTLPVAEAASNPELNKYRQGLLISNSVLPTTIKMTGHTWKRYVCVCAKPYHICRLSTQRKWRVAFVFCKAFRGFYHYLVSILFWSEKLACLPGIDTVNLSYSLERCYLCPMQIIIVWKVNTAAPFPGILFKKEDMKCPFKYQQWPNKHSRTTVMIFDMNIHTYTSSNYE